MSSDDYWGPEGLHLGGGGILNTLWEDSRIWKLIDMHSYPA